MTFDQLESLFEGASARCNGATHVFHRRIAGYQIRFRIAGSKLADTVKRAFAHLVADNAGAIALNIDVWDEQEANVAYTRPQVSDPTEPDVVLECSEDGRFVSERRAQSIGWLDRSNHKIVAFVASAEQQFLDQLAKPFNKLLSTWLHDRGIQFVHSGLVSQAGRGMLFVGSGGAGKSTSSIACLQGGINYLGDDMIALERASEGMFIGHSLFATCLLDVNHIKRFPNLVPNAKQATRAHETKLVVYLTELFPKSIERSTTISGLVLPRVVDSRHTTFRPASKAEAFLALAPSSVMFLPSPNPRALDSLSELVNTVPGYWLELGRNIDEIPEVVRALAERV